MTLTILQAELAHGPCPACGKPIEYFYAVDTDQLQKVASNGVILDLALIDATVVGIRIHHDCIPQSPTKMPNPPLESSVSSTSSPKRTP